ncbi:MAG: metallophosphoesterase family protein [Chloroflexi bacterium]|nr:metallophosphoesterase family protein [Chloroflexota bacterium]
MRIGIISDIHSNVVALERALEAMGTVDALWCLGDVVGYGPNPNECVALLLAQPSLQICLTGNHDAAALERVSWKGFNAHARRAIQWTHDQLNRHSLDFLSERPDKLQPDGDFTLAHASPRDPVWEYITSPAIARANFEHFNTPLCLVGHSHVPAIYTRREDGRVNGQTAAPGLPLVVADKDRRIINPGSVGQPRDGDPRAAFAIWDSDQRRFDFHRVAYDVAATQRRIIAAGLPSSLAARLGFGR